MAEMTKSQARIANQVSNGRMPQVRSLPEWLAADENDPKVLGEGLGHEACTCLSQVAADEPVIQPSALPTFTLHHSARSIFSTASRFSVFKEQKYTPVGHARPFLSLPSQVRLYRPASCQPSASLLTCLPSTS